MEYRVIILPSMTGSNLEQWESTMTGYINDKATQGWQLFQLVVHEAKLVAIFSKVK
ncbi:MAG: hypothetical protein MUO97_10865 [Dehalococcoidia bacterium]|nr:hypothetical protein [Dehalococcoidia bacterium]